MRSLQSSVFSRQWVLVVVTLAATSVRAGDWHLDAELLTDLPVEIGGRVGVEMPYGLRASTSVGYMPAGYVKLINAILTSAHAYNDATADLIQATIQKSLVWRTHVGWRLPGHGFYVDLGYGLVGLGGGATGEELIAAVTGQKRASEESGEHPYDVASALHMIDGEVGWIWDLPYHLTVRTALGVAATLKARAKVEAAFEPRPLFQKGVDAFEAYAEDYLVTTFETYVITPVFTVALGYRFF